MTQAYSYIRFSSAQQLKGDSLRRQLKHTQRFADEHGLNLDTSYRDLGVSAYKGTNRHRGALASFLRKIETGEIARGSYLIVENLDRLTREDVLSAVTLFLRIIEAGIVVVTLNDDMVYSTKTIIDRPNDLTVSIAAFIKGNREQKDKASRLLDAWEAKRDAIVDGSRKKLTRQGPGWLDLVADDPVNEPLVGDWAFNERAAVVRQVFSLCINGLGKELIARRLNAAGVPSFKGGDGWSGSTVLLLLTDRRAIGELQFYSKVDGVRREVGEPISGYYATRDGETVVSQETFYRAQSEIRKRYAGAGVGTTSKVPNLFTRLAQCSCGRALEYRDKRGKRNNAPSDVFLRCSGAQRHHQCSNATKYIYDETEGLVLDWITDVRISDEEANRSTIIGFKLEAKIAERADLQRRMEDALTRWEIEQNTALKQVLYKSAERHAAMLPKIEDDIARLEVEVRMTKRSVVDDRRAAVKRVREELVHLEGDARYDARAKLAAAIRAVVDHIEFKPDGSFYVTLKGGMKGYRFTDGRFVGAYDLNDANPKGDDPLLLFPTSETGKGLAPMTREGIRTCLEDMALAR